MPTQQFDPVALKRVTAVDRPGSACVVTLGHPGSIDCLQASVVGATADRLTPGEAGYLLAHVVEAGRIHVVGRNAAARLAAELDRTLHRVQRFRRVVDRGKDFPVHGSPASCEWSPAAARGGFRQARESPSLDSELAGPAGR